MAEKKMHPNCSPYRCLDCSQRFIWNNKNTQLNKPAMLTIIGLIAVFILILAIFLIRSWLSHKNENQLDISVLPSESKPVKTVDDTSRLSKAAEAGDANAQYKLGQSILQNFNRNPDETTIAIRWLMSSANSGNTDAMVTLGRLSKNGTGVLQNYAQALEWFKTASNHGNAEGMLELGRLYREGIAVEKDFVQAYIWFNRSAAQQNQDAVRERDAIARTLNADKLKEAQALSSAPKP